MVLRLLDRESEAESVRFQRTQNDKRWLRKSTRAFSGCGPLFSITNPLQVLPLAIVTLEAHALGNLESREQTSLDLLATFASVIAG